jgi:NitT/TauT family transport system substrate-binding protein
MDRSKGASEVDKWLGNIGAFMTDVGTLPKNPDANSYINDSAMKAVKADAALAAMANKTN